MYNKYVCGKRHFQGFDTQHFFPSAKPQKPLTFNKHCTFGYAECNKRRPLIDGASVIVSLDRNTLEVQIA